MRTVRRNIDEDCLGSDHRSRHTSCGQWDCYGNHGGARVGLVAPDRWNRAPGGTVMAWHCCHSQGGNVMIVEFKGWFEIPYTAPKASVEDWLQGQLQQDFDYESVEDFFKR